LAQATRRRKNSRVSASGLASQIHRRLKRADVAATDAVIGAVAAYLEVLARWNKRINLTAFDLTPPSDEAIDRLIVEPLAAVRYLRTDDRLVVDIGSGGGSPAIPIKLAVPSLRMVLFESRTRKSAFLREAVRALGLRDVDVETIRADPETIPARLQGTADVVTIRAVRADPGIWEAIETLVSRDGRVLWFGNLVNRPTRVNGLIGWKPTRYPLVGHENQLTILSR
jgi:16S rRNA (guanine527-N7)-methyltransferase